MIRPSYSLKLAQTKLRSKRAVLITSIIVASLLFAALITVVIVFTGAEKSASEFVKRAGNDRYLVNVSPNIPFTDVNYSNPPSLENIREIKEFEQQYYQTLRDKYKSLGLTYDASIEISALTPDATASKTLPEEQRVRINFSSPVITALNAQKFDAYAKTATNKFSDLKKAGSKYGASGYYIVDKTALLASLPDLRLVQNGKENFGDSDQKSGDSTPYGYYINAIHNGYYAFTDQNLLSRYVLTSNTTTLKGIPVVVSAQEAASMFGTKVGIGKEPDTASDKRSWLKSIQTKLNGQTYQVCHRNSTEQALLQKIQSDYADMENNKSNASYIKPSLIYDYPTTACGDVVIKQDTRTIGEKQADRNTQTNQKKLGTYIAPQHRLITFQIVGIKYAQSYVDYTKGIDEYVKSLLVSKDNYSSTLDIPIQMYSALPTSLKIDDIQDKSAALPQDSSDDFVSHVLEFTTVNNARTFLTNETCSVSASNCDKRFFASPYGSNYLILDEVSKLFTRIAAIAFPVALAMAAIIIWFTVSRIMAENRKETAVYRAMGAKRSDVTAVYFMYILLVALRIAVVSTVLGIVAALAVNYVYAQKLTDIAVTSFGIVDGAPMFSLFNLGSPLLPVTIGSIFIIGIVASIQPLIRNARRPPIRDIRDE
ncbi:MAG: FtsX-like permease family protein [Candidatus Saccharimonadales bacterium]